MATIWLTKSIIRPTLISWQAALPVPMNSVNAFRLSGASIASTRGRSVFCKEGLLNSSLSLSEVRVLYELAHREKPTAAELCKELELDAGYLSRILRAFHKRGWILRESSQHDARRSLLSLSRRGRAAFEPLNARSNQEVAKMLGALAPS